MKVIKSKDGQDILLKYSMRVGGPEPKSSKGGGQAFGTNYLYFSIDDGRNWHRSDHRSDSILAKELEVYTIAELKLLGFSGY